MNQSVAFEEKMRIVRYDETSQDEIDFFEFRYCVVLKPDLGRVGKWITRFQIPTPVQVMYFSPTQTVGLNAFSRSFILFYFAVVSLFGVLTVSAPDKNGVVARKDK